MSSQQTKDKWLLAGGGYEYRIVSFAPDAPKSVTRQALAAEAEQGRWELARSAIYWGGGKKVWLRRKTLTVESTLY